MSRWCRLKGDVVHERVGIANGLLPGARWLRSLLALAVLMFGVFVSAEQADARLAGRIRLAGDGAMALSRLALSRLAFAAREEEISPCAAQPAYPAGSLGGLFSRPGMIGGLAAGFLGAGVLGVLFGHGMVGELTGLPSILGLFLQLGLLLLFVRLIWTWWRLDKAAALAALSPRQLADAYGRSRNEGLGDAADGKNDLSKSEETMAGEKQHGL
jgi:hypothetical protein